MAESQIAKTHKNILQKIREIYDRYEEKSQKMKEQNNLKRGSTIDKAENVLLEDLEFKLQPELGKLINQMEKHKSLKGKYAGFVRSCHTSVKNILRKKPFNFKVTKQINELLQDTQESIKLVRSKLTIADQTTFLCCGVDGKKQFQNVINLFRIQAGKWQMIQTLQSKGSVDNFISPDFNSADFDFIKSILRNNWPTEREKIRQVKVEVPVEKIVKEYIRQDVGKSPLHQANEYLYGINRQENPQYALQIYHEQADKQNNPDACAFLGTVYQEGGLLAKDLKKAAKYYSKAMERKHPYATYRFAKCLIKGELNKQGINKDEMRQGYELLEQITKWKDPCPEALAELGYLYANGSFQNDYEQLFKVQKDLKKAIKFNEEARQRHVSRAVNNLGILFYRNKDLNPQNPNQKIDQGANRDQNIRKSINYLYEAQKQGYPQAYYNLGVIHKQLNDPEKALRYFYEASLKKDYLSKIKFAYELMNQTSILKEEFEEHYKLAAYWLQGVVHSLSISEIDINSQAQLEKNLKERAEALYYLGLIHENGFGVEKSPRRAFNYFVTAADADYPAAKNKLGDCYFSGYGVRMDRQMAIGLYLEAVELNNSDAMVNLGTIYLNGIPDMVERDNVKAHEYFCKAIDLENSDAMIHLSYMYRKGLGVEPDEQMSKKLLEKAAGQKNSTALYMLKEMADDYDRNILYHNLENEFFSEPHKIDLREIVPLISTIQ